MIASEIFMENIAHYAFLDEALNLDLSNLGG
jgi:hypothetical protein